MLDDDNKIYLNESGENRIIVPNNNFRIFLIMNNNLGEVSRALKNRCVELYFNGYYIRNNKILENENLFFVKGNYFEIEINLFSFGIVKFNTFLLFDLIKMNIFPFFLSFDMIISFYLYLNIYLIFLLRLKLNLNYFSVMLNKKHYLNYFFD